MVLVTWIGALWAIWWRRADWPASDASLGLELCAMFVPVVCFCTLDRGFASENNAFVMQLLAMLALTTQLMLRHEPETTSRRERAVANSPSLFERDRRMVPAFQRGGESPPASPRSTGGGSP
jgi:hypothetical protein